MAFQQSVTLKDCNFTYHISPAIKKYTLREVSLFLAVPHVRQVLSKIAMF
ncbi:hypothetical protein DP112_04370 [Streptococcus suis]|nr:hypothetical protein DP112_04370 [Streptococcus suis]